MANNDKEVSPSLQLERGPGRGVKHCHGWINIKSVSNNIVVLRLTKTKNLLIDDSISPSLASGADICL